MGKQADGEDDNLILFPGLVTKLIEKGMTSLKEKRYYDALKFFHQSIDLEPEHEQARYGLVITNIELNRLDVAKTHCESMLREGIGSYFETLEVYVSLLIQLGEYEEVKTLLESVMQEEKLPAQMAETFYQLLEFSRQMTSSTMLQHSTQDEKIEPIPDNKEWLEILEEGKPEQQWDAVQKMSQINTDDMVKACATFLKRKENNPVLKSYILQMLKELEVEATLEVTKFNETFYIHIDELEDVFHERFGNEVLKRLESELGQDNPSLYDIVKQVWWHYLFALYPKPPKPQEASVWAASLHILGNILIGDTEEANESICERYEAEIDQVNKALEHLTEVESQLISIENDHM